MKPTYRTVSWLFWRGVLSQVINLTEQDIRVKQKEIETVAAENSRIYAGAVRDRDQQRTDFRQLHPYKNYPNYLKEGVQQPPGLMEKWRKLLRQREKHFHDLEQQREEKKWTFLDRMENGRVNAMQRRERAMRELINQTAQEQGIDLYERALDVRLAELLNHLTKLREVAQSSVEDEPMVMC